MLKSTVLGLGFAAVVSTAAMAQPYYPYYPPGYSYPAYSYGYGYPYYGSYYPYYYPAYRPAPAYSDPYVALRPYSDRAGPAASGHTGY
ncbi:MAG: hypothetical protein ACREET_04125 [Stellaceae bacterium]